MKSLVESLFDKDLVKRSIPIPIDIVCDNVLKSLKKYHFIEIPFEKIDKGYVPQKNFIMIDQLPDDQHSWFTFSICVPNQLYFKKHDEREGMCMGISFVIDKSDNDNDEYVYLSRLDVVYMKIFKDATFFPGNEMIWDGDEYKTETRLKTNKFETDTIDQIIKYIHSSIDKLLKITTRDQKKLSSLPPTRGYISNIKKELC